MLNVSNPKNDYTKRCLLIIPSRLVYYYPTLLQICTISSSASTCSFPHRCGWCFADRPHTHACENWAMMPLCNRLQNSSIVGLSECRMTGSSSHIEIGRQEVIGTNKFKKWVQWKCIDNMIHWISDNKTQCLQSRRKVAFPALSARNATNYPLSPF